MDFSMQKNKERNATHGRFITAKRLFSVAVSHTGLSTRSAKDFERWLESQGRTRAEMTLKARLRKLDTTRNRT
jgi:hypothetical protein